MADTPTAHGEDVPFPSLIDFMGEERYEKYSKFIESVDDLETSSALKEGPARTWSRNRRLVDQKVVYQQNAWDDVEWDEVQKAEAAQKVEINSTSTVDDHERVQLEEKAADYWTKFYSIHQNKFFRDRTWLFTEFPDLIGPFGASVDSEISKSESEVKRSAELFPGEKSKFRVLEVGCGNGSTVIPLLRYNNHPELYVYCCDFSPQAVQIVASSSDLDSRRCTPFVWDITQDDATLPFPPESLDIVSMIFVLSAISPEKFDCVFRNMFKVLKPGGLILFRDYGLYDLVQLRIKPGHCISQNFYFRGDRTRVYFFTEDEVDSIFRRNGYTKLSLFTDRRLQVNRLKQLKMYRIWLQGRFQKTFPKNEILLI